MNHFGRSDRSRLVARVDSMLWSAWPVLLAIRARLALGLLIARAAELLRRQAESASRGALRAGPDHAAVRYRGHDPAEEPGRTAGGATRVGRAGAGSLEEILARSESRRVAQVPVW